ncbi:unnamed protein product [Vicia faba]|uniref:GATA transcription factor 19-like n=1 Tax=Vicia faba TaxID=3906 RepID=A0AAV1B5N2_VICFA|nr:unnamed protein product [Vicia faba]
METVNSCDDRHCSNVAEQPQPILTPATELTISFQGDVYVFPSVTPQKLQAVLLLLGGQETPNTLPSSHFLLPLNYHHISGINDPSRNSKLSRRFASLVRFREKRKDRCFQKKIRYTCRKEVAERMQRKNGQFASLKEEYNSPTENQDSSSGTPCPKSTERRCQHCEIGEKSTPVMRRGPAGPRSLCNACGLMWANKGTLRELNRSGRIAFEHNELDTSTDITPSTTDPENSCAAQDKEESPRETKPVPMDAIQSPEMIDEQYMVESAEAVIDNLSIQVENNALDLQELDKTMEDLADASGIDFEIPSCFDDQVDVDDPHMRTYWL